MKNIIFIIISLTLLLNTGCQDENIFYQESQNIHILEDIEVIAGKGNPDILFEPLNKGDTCNIEDLYIKVILKGPAIKEYPKPAGLEDNSKPPYNIYNNIDKILLCYSYICPINEEGEIMPCFYLHVVPDDFLRVITNGSSMMLNDFLKQAGNYIPSNLYVYFDGFAQTPFSGTLSISLKITDKNENVFFGAHETIITVI